MTVRLRRVLRFATGLAKSASAVLLLMQDVDVMNEVMEIVRKTRREPQGVDNRIEEAPRMIKFVSQGMACTVTS